jgi:hypothetical protein
MNETKARFILGIDNGATLSPELLKRKYRTKALQYHPDKNPLPDANIQFQQVYEAYEYLSNMHLSTGRSLYTDMLNKILTANNPTVQLIITKLSSMCEETAISYIHSIDKSLLMEIYKRLVANKDKLHIPDKLIIEMRRILIARTQGDERILLNPSLDDLWNDNVYKLIAGENTFMVPLWHHELVYDNNGSDLYVKCIPTLPDNIEIDESNNIIISLKYDIRELFKLDIVNVDAHGRIFSFRPDELRIVKNQQLKRTGVGISRIKQKNVYDVSSRADVLLNIELTI